MSLNVRTFTSTKATDEKESTRISIGNVSVPSAPIGSGRLDLVPSLEHMAHLNVNDMNMNMNLPPCSMSHLRWMLQKDLALKQDFLLLGPPSLARDRRYLVLLYAALVGREVEYMSLTRDTSDADLKQRREVCAKNSDSTNNTIDQSSVYVNQAPVRAALNGRLLVLDGLEKAERNVLPTLNNLLENRELSLDDGGMLVHSDVYDRHNSDNDVNVKHDMKLHGVIHRVHPDFRVAAMASLSEGDGAILDPPLRSRFQGRLASTVPIEDMLVAASATSRGIMDVEVLKDVVQIAAASSGGFSLQSVKDAVQYLERHESCMTPTSIMKLHGLGMLDVKEVISPMQVSTSTREPSKSSLSSIHSSIPSSHSEIFVETTSTRTMCDVIMAGFESGKRGVALVGPKGSFKSAIAREVARRHKRENEIELFSLYPDLTSRDLLMVRGTDELGNTVWRETPLTRAVKNGTWVILDGIDKLSKDTLTSLALLMEQGQLDLPNGKRLHDTKDSFRCIALAHPPDENEWITPEATAMFHWIQVKPYSSSELMQVLSGLHPTIDTSILSKIVELRDKLDDAIERGAADSVAERESLILSLRKIRHICRRVEHRGSVDLPKLVHSAQMTSFMPDRERRIVESSMSQCGIIESEKSFKKAPDILNEELIAECSRSPTNPLLVPNPRFEENPGHARVMNDILEAHNVGERALLIMGYQGVGKNRVVDYLLSRLQCEREYLQLHRDTTVQSLLSSPSIEDGRIIYNDSALVRAARHGRILVLDEVDKAPVEVVALLKGLIEDGELALPDGRVLRYKSVGSDDSSSNPDIVPIHPDFHIWALANPVGYPFKGNDFAREMADIFSCHTVPPMDTESHKRILSSYGPNVSHETIHMLIDIWDELRETHQKGLMSYPFSVRESVAVVKHLNKFPDDGIDIALENVIAFDRLDSALLEQLNSIVSKHGIRLTAMRSSTHKLVGSEGGISTPKTRTAFPKHGKIDPDNTPHVGGNTWAGGTGGSDTAGLGGRGGPYRLDAGHPVHQISDEMKAEVSEEAKRKARKMAQEALDQKLKELKLGLEDWDRYNSVRERVAAQIQQLQVHLKDIRRRKEERVWLRRQSNGELDDTRLVDAVAGEKDVFKRRGVATESNNTSLAIEPTPIKLVVDVSASMYRFNGYDGRLQRLLEACVMIMDALCDDDRFLLEIVGHNGTSAVIPLVDKESPLDAANQLRVLETMVAHTQYTYAGDRTLEAIESATNNAKNGDLILVITDANLNRYRIEAEEVSELIGTKDRDRNRDIHTHLILIGSIGEEANELAQKIPNGRAQVCFDSSDLPIIIKNIVANAAK